MADDHGEKTLPPTPERRKRMRAAGHVAQSADLSSAGVLLGGLLALVVTGGALVTFLAGLLTAQLSGESWLPAVSGDLAADSVLAAWTPLASSLGKALMPLLAAILLVGVGLNLAANRLLVFAVAGTARRLAHQSRCGPVADRFRRRHRSARIRSGKAGDRGRRRAVELARAADRNRKRRGPGSGGGRRAHLAIVPGHDDQDRTVAGRAGRGRLRRAPLALSSAT